MNTVKIVRRSEAGNEEITEQTPEVRVRINFTVSTANVFQPDITSEADNTETAMANLLEAHTRLEEFRKANGYDKAQAKVGK